MKNKELCLAVLLLLPVMAAAGTRGDIEALQISQQEAQQRLQSLESSLQNQGLLEMAQTFERMQLELRELRGMLEQQGHEMEGIRKRQRELYLDIDRRLNDIQLQGVDSKIAPAETSSVQKQQPVASNADQERAEYKAAFETLADGQHKQSINSFIDFLQKYPNSKYADNAQYWLGEANYASKNFDQAIKEFNIVLKQYSNSSKVPDAKLKLGYTYYELKQWEGARTILTDILNTHPSASVAPLAEKRLLRMTKEGR